MKNQKVMKENKPLTEFLVANPLAKIVIVVDTHSTSIDGQFVYGIEGQVTYSDFLGGVFLFILTLIKHQLTKPDRFSWVSCRPS
jgi:hypothetical protein